MESENTEILSPTHGVDMTQGHVGRHLIKFAIPMLMGSAMQTAYSVINAIWVGNGLGKDAIGAIAVSFPVFFLLLAVAFGLSMASNILISQAYGAKNYSRVKVLINNSMVMTIVASIVCVVLGHYFAERLLLLMATPPEILPLSTSYLRMFVFTVPFMFVVFTIAAILRAVGDSKTPLYFQAGGVILTAILDPFLMFGWWGFPRYGLPGTVYATIFAQLLVMVLLIGYLAYKKHIASPDWFHLNPDWGTCWLTIKIGIPSIIQQALVSVGMLVLFTFINHFGHNATAAFGIAMRIDQIAFIPVMTIGMAVSTLAGQNIGARKFERIPQIYHWGLITSGGVTLLITLMAVGIPGILLRMFVKDQEVLQLGAQYLRIVGIGYLFLSVMFIGTGIINGAGHTFITTIMSIVALWLIRIPLAYYFTFHNNWLNGIWWSMDLGFFIGMLMSISYYLSGKWKNPVSKTTPAIISETP